ncbi:MAG: N-acetylmuramoyl-L-alanine amidase, partial [Oscillospiraceae bacterium]|nr:N-acetylmuramoyl-L-alanine amidase [Oscillospiraceae bacterium]
MHTKITRYLSGFALFSFIFVFLGLGFFQLGQADYASILANNPAAVNTEPAPQGQTIIIDPGHGGRDSGALGADRGEEKDINLAVSLVLADLLRLSGHNVIMTRTEDDDLGNDIRGQRKLTDL